jgi:hypothetical protein
MQIPDQQMQARDSARTVPRPSWPSRRFALLKIVAAFVASRALYNLSGNGFATNLGFWQFLDLPLLQSRLWQSLFYLHSQPPLLNLLLGAAVKFFPASYPLVLQVLFAAIGLALAIVMFLLMTELDVPIGLALLITLVFEIGPATLMFENWFYDTYPTAFVLVLAAFCLNRFMREKRRLYGWAFACCLALPVLMNSSFQVVWFLGVAAALYLLLRQQTRPLLAPGLAMLAVIMAWYVKNLLLFGTLSTSSWLGMNLCTMTTFQVPPAERYQLAVEGKLSALSLAGAFVPLGAFSAPLTGVPALDEKTKQDGQSNYNNIAYIQLSRICLHDAVWVLLHRPKAYLHAVAATARLYLQPASHEPLALHRNQTKMAGWIALYERGLLAVPVELGGPYSDGEIRYGNQPPDYRVSILLAVAVPLLTVWGFATVIRGGKRLPIAARATLLFAVLGIVYTGLTGILFNAMENSRFRYVADPLYLLLLAVFISQVIRSRAPDRVALSGR